MIGCKEGLGAFVAFEDEGELQTGDGEMAVKVLGVGIILLFGDVNGDGDIYVRPFIDGKLGCTGERELFGTCIKGNSQILNCDIFYGVW